MTDTKAEIELKPCPFCGASIAVRSGYDIRGAYASCSNPECPVRPEVEADAPSLQHGALDLAKAESIVREKINTRTATPSPAERAGVPEWLLTLDYQRDLALIWMVAKQSKYYDETIGDRIERVQTLILELKKATQPPTGEPAKVTEAQAMRVLWDAGYKIHGQWGWVQDGRSAYDNLLNAAPDDKGA